jgi:arylsulfatase A-like enzyme
MLGEQDGPGLASVDSQYRLDDMLRTADEQLGRILDELETRGLAERTMVVVTADHGGQRHEAYLGNNRSQSCCPYENTKEVVDPPYWLQHLNNVGKLRTAYADSVITLWLADHAESNELALIRGLQDVSGVTEVYAKRKAGESYRYEQVYSSLERQDAAFRSWANKHSEELANTMAGPGGPDLIALLADGYGFGRIGGHGGAQEKVQRIPMIIRVPGEKPSTRTMALRLVDLAPEIAKTLGLTSAGP